MDKLLEIIKSFIPNFESLSSIPLSTSMGPGWLFGVFGTVAMSLYGLSLGKTKAVLSLLSLYVSFVIIKLFPYIHKIGQMIDKTVEDYWLKIGIFVAIYIIVFLIFSFSFIRKRLAATEFSLFGIILISVLQLGFFGSIIFSFLPQDLAIKWSFAFYNYIATPQALFIWAIAPLPGLLFLKQK